MIVRISRNCNNFIFVILNPIDTVFKAGLVVACYVGTVDSQPFPTLGSQWLTVGKTQQGLLKVCTLRIQVWDCIDPAPKIQLVGHVDFAEFLVPTSQTKSHVEADPVAQQGQVLDVDLCSLDAVLPLGFLVGVDVVRLGGQWEALTRRQACDL